MNERAETARTYYRSIDGGEYGRLEAILTSGFVHERPDRTLSGAGEFVRFMREERPMTDTTHTVDAVYHESDGGDDGIADDASGEVAIRGRLRRGDDDLFGFIDVFAFDGTDISRLRTYTQ